MRFVSAFVLAAGLAGAANAFVPGDAPVPVSPPGGPLAPGGEAADNYIDFGVDFTWGGVEGIFNDPPLAFGGVNGSGVVDLVSPVDGRIVVPGSLTTGSTSFFYAEAGFSADGSLTLELFDATETLVATLFNGPPLGANGRTTFTYNGAPISYFRISGQDSFGVNEILLDPQGVIPEPATWAMMIAGFGLVGFAARRRRPLAA
jgi:hypothetical protein